MLPKDTYGIDIRVAAYAQITEDLAAVLRLQDTAFDIRLSWILSPQDDKTTQKKITATFTVRVVSRSVRAALKSHVVLPYSMRATTTRSR